jgi:hypothetical protein
MGNALCPHWQARYPRLNTRLFCSNRKICQFHCDFPVGEVSELFPNFSLQWFNAFSIGKNVLLMIRGRAVGTRKSYFRTSVFRHTAQVHAFPRPTSSELDNLRGLAPTNSIGPPVESPTSNVPQHCPSTNQVLNSPSLRVQLHNQRQLAPTNSIGLPVENPTSDVPSTAPAPIRH